MSIQIRIHNTTTNKTLAFVEIPDAALPRLQAVFGTADNALAFMVRKLRDRTLSVIAEQAQATGRQAAADAETAERQAFDTEFPSV